MSRIKREKVNRGINIIGKIKVGMKHPEKGYPMSLDYFRFTSRTKGYADKALELFGKTNNLRVTFMKDDEKNNCDQRMELRTAGGNLVAYTDLERLFISKEDGMLEIDKSVIEEKGGIKTVMKKLEARHTTPKYKAKF